MLLIVQYDFADNQLFFCFIRFAASKHRFNTGYHFHHTKRFYKIIVCTCIKSLNFIHLRTFCSCHNYRNFSGFRMISDFLQYIYAVLSWQHDIKYDQFRLLSFQCFQHRASVCKPFRLKSGFYQSINFNITNGIIIINTPNHTTLLYERRSQKIPPTLQY